MNSTPILAKAAEFFEDAEALDAPADLLREAARKLTANPTAKAMLTGQASGSPLHPALVHLPIGAAISALVVDLLGGEHLDEAVQLLTGLTVAAALPTAVTGLADYADKYGAGVRRLGVAHAVANLAGTKLLAASWLVRRRGGRLGARALLLAGVSAYGLGGMLGGHIVHARNQPASVG